MSGPITSAYALMIRVSDIVIAVEVRLDKSKVREEAVQLAGRSLCDTSSVFVRTC